MSSLQGKLLIAASPLQDPNFTRSVSLIVQHDEHGAMGLVLNRPTEMSVQEVWAEISDSPCGTDQMIYAGGPCEGPLMVIHGRSELGDREVIPGVYFSVSPEAVRTLIATEPEPVRYLAGYAGWGVGQLEAELAAGSWLVADASAEQVFGGDESAWRRLVWRHDPTSPASKIDPKYIPQDPSMN